MSIFDNLFGKGATPPKPEVSPETPSGTATPPSQEPAAPAAPVSPLDQFKDLWKADPEAKPKSGKVFDSVDPKQLMDAAGKIDFSAAVTPEQMQTIAAGGEDAVKAMMTVMNQMSQQAYAQSAFATTQIVNEAIARAKSGLDSDLPGMVKRVQAKESLKSENPIFSNPAVQPMMDALQSQMAVKFPQASPAELTKMTKDFVLALSDSLKPAEKTTSKNEPTQDFSDFFSSNFSR